MSRERARLKESELFFPWGRSRTRGTKQRLSGAFEIEVIGSNGGRNHRNALLKRMNESANFWKETEGRAEFSEHSRGKRVSSL